jgi:cyclohexadieny/prephenate dehydrogenase / 3-phosphoshikimate 1-carboxyvinyltransferase
MRLPVIGGAPVPGAPPRFQRVAVVGLGAVGGSLALAVRRAWPQSVVIGVDTREVIETAIRLHAIDVGSDDLLMAGDADLVVLAAGAEENARVMPYLADAIPGDAVVLALGGEPAGERARALPRRLPVVSGVPAVELRGCGIRAASADLFLGRSWTISAVTAGTDAVGRVHDLVRAIGGDAGA